MMAEEFIPPSMMSGGMYAVGFGGGAGLGFYPNNGFEVMSNGGVGFGTGRRVTEEQLVDLFIKGGQVVDCRVCGDPNLVLRFAFIEFTDERGQGRL